MENNNTCKDDTAGCQHADNKHIDYDSEHLHPRRFNFIIRVVRLEIEPIIVEQTITLDISDKPLRIIRVLQTKHHIKA